MGYFANLSAALRGRFAIKASQVGPLIARLMVGQAVWSKRDFAKLATEGYQQNPVVARSVDLIAEAVADIPWVLYKGRGSKKTEVDEHPFLDMLSRPNPGQDRAAFLMACVSNLKIAGNLYIERTEEKDFERMELYAHRPERIRIIPGETGVPAAYEYTVNGAVRRFEVDETGARPMLHVKRWNPTDDWYGMSPLDPASWDIDIHNAAAKWNMSLLNNSGAPSGAFVYEGNKETGGRMGDEMFAQLKRELEENVQGARNAGRPLLLEGGLTWQQMGLDAERMQFVESMNASARRIAFMLGVPSMLLGIPGDNTYSNYQEARLAFYQETVIPLARRLVAAFNEWFATALGKGVYIDIDLDNIDALQIVRDAQWTRLDRTTMLSLNEKREAIGYEKVDGGDEHFVSAGQIPISTPAVVDTSNNQVDAPPEKQNGSAKHMPKSSVHSPQR